MALHDDQIGLNTHMQLSDDAIEAVKASRNVIDDIVGKNKGRYICD